MEKQKTFFGHPIGLYFSNYKFGIGMFLFTEEERISMFQGLEHF